MFSNGPIQWQQWMLYHHGHLIGFIVRKLNFDIFENII
jgi:hypothetical protein